MPLETTGFNCKLICHHLIGQTNRHSKCWKSLTGFLKQGFTTVMGETFLELKVFNSTEVIPPFIPCSLKVRWRVRMNDTQYC